MIGHLRSEFSFDSTDGHEILVGKSIVPTRGPRNVGFNDLFVGGVLVFMKMRIVENMCSARKGQQHYGVCCHILLFGILIAKCFIWSIILNERDFPKIKVSIVFSGFMGPMKGPFSKSSFRCAS